MTSSYSPVLTTKAVKDETEQRILRDAHVCPLHRDTLGLHTTDRWDNYVSFSRIAWVTHTPRCIHCTHPVQRHPESQSSPGHCAAGFLCRWGTQWQSSNCWCGWRRPCRRGKRRSWLLHNTSTSVAGESVRTGRRRAEAWTRMLNSVRHILSSKWFQMIPLHG